MNLKRLASILLCVSITAFAFSGCKNHGGESSPMPETVYTVPPAEEGMAEAGTLFQTGENELTTETAKETIASETTPLETISHETTPPETISHETTPPETISHETTPLETITHETTPPVTSSAEAESSPPQTTTPKSEETAAPETTAPEHSVKKDGSYTTPEDVAEYIHTFGSLPKNFISKSEAKSLGWDSSEGNLWDVAKGKSIGGDRFGNYEGLLPNANGRTYTECDVNYSGGFRGSERIVFSNDGLIYYTNDHYKTFTKLY